MSIILSCGFLRIFTYTDDDGFFKFRLGKVRVKECPGGLELPAVARNRKKASVKIRKKRNFGFYNDPKTFTFKKNVSLKISIILIESIYRYDYLTLRARVFKTKTFDLTCLIFQIRNQISKFSKYLFKQNTQLYPFIFLT